MRIIGDVGFIFTSAGENPDDGNPIGGDTCWSKCCKPGEGWPIAVEGLASSASAFSGSAFLGADFLAFAINFLNESL